MIFTVQDIELLRLLRWCRYANPNDLMRVFDKTTISNLIALKLVKKHKPRGYLSLTAAGNALVEAKTD